MRSQLYHDVPRFAVCLFGDKNTTLNSDPQAGALKKSGNKIIWLSKLNLEYLVVTKQVMNAQKLQDCIAGKVYSADYVLNYYSVDSSFYRKRPKLIVVPKTISDIVRTLQFARKNTLSVTPRGGGTGLVGSALNDGIILDLKNFDKIRVSQNYVVVGAGVHKGRLDDILAINKKILGPNPSVGPYCTIGGMIGTNASGSRSLKYGSTIDNLLEVTMVTAGGKVLKLPSKTDLAKYVSNLAKMLDRSSFPQVTKNSCGYRLDAVNSISETQKIVAASEGTLGIIVSAKLCIFDMPKRQSLFILGYDSVRKAANDCKNLVKTKPSALEFVDHTTMKNLRVDLPRKIKCLLFVEFDSNIRQNSVKLAKLSSGITLYKLTNKKTIAEWWAFRNSALHFSLKNTPSEETFPHIIEDAAVPPENLERLVDLAENIRKKYGVRLVMYGHAGDGNIHIRLASANVNKKTVNCLAKEFFSQVVSMNGTITGEHGDGIARSRFVRMQYGPKAYALFSKLKRKFDPENMLNPHKIVNIR